MKRNLLSIALVIITFCYTTAQEVTAAKTQQADTSLLAQEAVAKSAIQCGVTPVSHWSVGIKSGLNYFRVAPQPVTRLDQVHLIVGGTVEYSFSPLAGVGLEYNYNPYGRPYYVDATFTTKGNITGGTHDIILYGSINMSNLLVPYRKGFGSKLNVYADAGVGYAFYKNSLDDYPNGTYESPMGNVGVNAEYSLTKSLALGLEGQYRFYHRKLVSGTKTEKSNALTTTVGLRYKFDANGNRQHARNISMCEYYPKPAPVIIQKITKDSTPETLNRLKAIEAENLALNDKIKKMNDDIVALSSRNNTVEAKEQGLAGSSYKNIEFQFGSDKLVGSAYPILDQIAVLLKNNPNSVKLSVAGYTDYVGTEEFNQALSIKRANAVRVYLLNKKVPASSISIMGYGKVNPIATNKTKAGRQMNRRVEFQIIK